MADLPSGAVTFLFTDIEGSTAVWESDQVAMWTAVDRHFAMLDTITQAHGGDFCTRPGRRSTPASPPRIRNRDGS